jgi:hypothetical protein
MKTVSITLVLAVTALMGVPASLAAQETKTARGTVSVTVEAVGGSTKTRQAQAAGQPGPKLSEVLKVGQPVMVSYTESGGAMKAVSIRAVSSLGSPTPAGGAAQTANGTVKSIAVTSLSVAGSSGGGATFTQTFTIDNSTKVIGKGAGTAAAAAGGKTVVTDLVAVGDTVSVTYHTMGNTLHAAEIRVTTKAPAK